jgi:hypothetical protein
MLFVSRSKHTLEIIFLAIIIVIGAFGYGAYVFSKSPSAQVATQPAGPVVIKGVIVCLPHRDTTGPQTTECAFGLKDTAGRYYGLHDSSPSYKNISSVPMNTMVEVVGTFAPKEDTKYQSSGMITVTSITVVANTPTPATVASSGVKGTVLLGPTCPMERVPADPACADRAYAAKLQLMNQDATSVIKTFSSDSAGRYQIAVAPGTYVIRSVPTANIFPSCSSGTIVVKAHTYTTMPVSCDTGIR